MTRNCSKSLISFHLESSDSQPMSNICHGLILDSTNWPVIPGTPIPTNFPWLHMCDGPDHLPFEVELRKGILSSCSPNCFHTVIDGDQSCFPCSQLASRLEILAQNANERKPHMHYSLLTPFQLLSLLDECNDLVNNLKLQVCILFHPIHQSH